VRHVEVLEIVGLLVDAVDLCAIEKALVVVELDGPPGFTLGEVEVLGSVGRHVGRGWSVMREE
jgi:hypothetical protein